MLNYLILNNFKKHINLEIEFSPKLTLLQGKNYQGKSSVLHSILYALGGARQVPGGSAVIRNKATGKKETVELGFHINGADYKVVRSGNNATLHKGDKLEATGTSSVNSEISKILGMPLKLFTATHYSAQGAAKMLVEMGAPALNRLLEEACEVDLIDRVLEALKPRQTKLEAQIEAIPEVEEGLDEREVSLRADLNKLKEKLDAAKAKKAEASTELDGANVQLTNVRNDNKVAVETETDRTTLAANLESATNQVVSLNSALASLASYTPLSEIKEKIETLPGQINKLQAAKDQAKTDTENKGAAQTKLTTANASLKELYTALTDLPDIVSTKALIDDISTTDIALGSAKKHASDAEALLEGGVCPTCERAHEDFDAEVTKKILSLATEEEALLVEAKQGLQTELEKADLQNASRDKVSREAIAKETSILELEEALIAIHVIEFTEEDELKGLAASLKELNNELLEATRLETEKKVLRQQISDTEESISTYQVRLNELPPVVIPIEVEPYEQKVSEAQASLRVCGDQVATYDSTYRVQYSEWEALKKAVAAAKQNGERLQQLEKDFSTGVNLTKFLRDNRSKFMDGLWASITGAASNMLETCTEGIVSEIVRGPDGEFTYIEEGKEMPIAAASGCQKAIIGTALKQAVRAAMPAGIPLALLDEVTADMDDAHAFAISSQLAASGEQIVAVSHRESDGFAADCQVAL